MKAYQRIVLKLSGEVMAGPQGFGIDNARVAEFAQEIAEVHAQGIEIGLVVGGGNIFRGISAAAKSMDRVAADHMGMLATVMNGLALQDALERLKVPTRLMTAIRMEAVAEPYIRRRALRHLEKGRIVLFAAGTSNPFFSTDSGAALRALEIHAQVLAKATKVDGVYDKDPMKHADAIRFPEISYTEVLSRGLRILDASAVAMCRDNSLPINVFNSNVRGNIMRMALGEPIGTLIHEVKAASA
jgi:uridylate kinase